MSQDEIISQESLIAWVIGFAALVFSAAVYSFSLDFIENIRYTVVIICIIVLAMLIPYAVGALILGFYNEFTE